MVKHGRAKKGRSSSRHNKAMSGSYSVAKYKNPKGLFSDSEVKATWDPKMSARKNLSKLGLAGSANDDIKRPSQQAFITTEALDPVELYDVPSDGRVRASKKHSDILLPMSVSKQEYIVKCVMKHGLNFKKMQMDVKTNEEQETERQLEKMWEKFKGLKEEERVVDWGERVEELLEEE
ncbi:hypothetical protein TrLO_g1367 [Triparma laevis f. longispina]|nr:hypothetical protein TrLO_g1367 [Triparma laevis f. longispina]